jgi:hypothetical protein
MSMRAGLSDAGSENETKLTEEMISGLTSSKQHARVLV